MNKKAYENLNDGLDKSFKSTNSMLTIEVQDRIEELDKKQQNLSNESKKMFFDLDERALAEKFQKTKDEILKMSKDQLIDFQNDLIFFGLEESMRLIRKIFAERQNYLSNEKYISAKEKEEIIDTSKEPTRSLGNKIKRITNADFLKIHIPQDDEPSSIPLTFDNEISKDDSTNFEYDSSYAHLKRNQDSYFKIHPEEKKNPSLKKSKTNNQEQKTPLALLKEDHSKFSQEIKDHFEKDVKKTELKNVNDPKESTIYITKEGIKEQESQRRNYYRKLKGYPAIFKQYFEAFPSLNNGYDKAIKIDITGEKHMLIELIFLQSNSFCERSTNLELWTTKQ